MKKLFMLLLFPLLFNAQKVIDGDTFDYKGKRYRLAFIDAPELSQNIVGQLSKKHLESIIDVTNMKVISKDKYGRYIVILGNINYRMVLNGYAIVYKKYCKNYKYFRAEKFAKTNKLGIHKYYFINPQEYRKQNNYGKFKTK